jgi:competence protein ComEA
MTIMTYTQPFQTLNRALPALRHCSRHCGAAAALLMALALGAALGAVSAPLHAQEAMPPAPVTTTVNINTADAAALAAGLNGVGPSRAEEIVRYRETYGPFASVDELAEVKGIGESTLEKNRSVITLE